MSWGGRWQKGLSHQACVASGSEQGKTRPLGAAASLGLASRQGRPLPPFAPLAPSPAGSCLGSGRADSGVIHRF